MDNAAFDPLRRGALALFLASTPCTMAAVFLFGCDRPRWACYNGVAFSSAFLLLFLGPLLSPCVKSRERGAGDSFVSSVSFSARLQLAMDNWILWLTCFTQIAIQIPHNLFAKFLWERRGGVVEWPFYAYGLSDRRWSEYTPDGETFGLAGYVELINWNDGLLGLCVLAAYLYRRRQLHSGNTASIRASTVALALVVVFRDATLWRETVEYLGEHFFSGHAFSTVNPAVRKLAIANIYLINGLWILAPMLSPVWAWFLIHDAFVGDKLEVRKRE
jgi:hypothetical protein